MRYADDFLVLVHGTRSDAEALRDEIGGLLASKLKITLSAEKTLITHIDNGFDFLGFHIQRKRRCDGRPVVLTSPSRAALAALMYKIKRATSRSSPSPCSPSAATGQPCPAAHDPRISQ